VTGQVTGHGSRGSSLLDRRFASPPACARPAMPKESVAAQNLTFYGCSRLGQLQISAAQSRRSELVATGEWSHCVMSCRIGWMAAACGAGKSGIQGPAAGLCGSSAVLGPARRLGCCEELVHDLGAGGDDGPEFAAVDDLGGAGGGVPGQPGDLLDGDSLVAQQADERGAQLARGPAVPGPVVGTA